MIRSTLSAALFAFCSLALAQVPNLGALKAQNPVQVSAEEMQQLVPGAKVMSKTAAGSTRFWTNNPDGTLSASSDGRGATGGRGYPSSASGTWNLDGQGRWCVKIQWNGPVDDWCRYLFKVGGKYYGYSRLQDDALGFEFELSH